MKRAFLFAFILLLKVFIKSPKSVQSTRLSKVTFGIAKNEENRMSAWISKVSFKFFSSPMQCQALFRKLLILRA